MKTQDNTNRIMMEMGYVLAKRDCDIDVSTQKFMEKVYEEYCSYHLAEQTSKEDVIQKLEFLADSCKDIGILYNHIETAINRLKKDESCSISDALHVLINDFFIISEYV